MANQLLRSLSERKNDVENLLLRQLNTYKGIGKSNDVSLKIIWKSPKNNSKPIAFFGKICYNWINPK